MDTVGSPPGQGWMSVCLSVWTWTMEMMGASGNFCDRAGTPKKASGLSKIGAGVDWLPSPTVGPATPEWVHLAPRRTAAGSRFLVFSNAESGLRTAAPDARPPPLPTDTTVMTPASPCHRGEGLPTLLGRMQPTPPPPPPQLVTTTAATTRDRRQQAGGRNPTVTATSRCTPAKASVTS